MSVKIREKRNKLYLDIYINGQRHWESLGLSIPEDKQQRKEVYRLADICRAKREMQVVTGEWGLLDELGSKQTLYSYIQDIAKTRDKKDKMNKCLKYLDLFPNGNTIKLSQVNEKWIKNFQEFLLSTSLSNQTASHYSTAIRYALRKAVQENILPNNPAEAVKGISVPESDKINLTAEEVQALANTQIGGKLGAEVRKAFLFAIFTGLRISDIKTITWADIDRTGKQLKKRMQKTQRFVYVPLNDNAYSLINDNQIHTAQELVFSLLGTTKTNTNEYLITWAKKAEIEKKIGWHTARHTFATLTLENGADFFTVSKLLGHTKTTVTAVYTKATDKLKREAVDALPNIKVM